MRKLHFRNKVGRMTRAYFYDHVWPQFKLGVSEWVSVAGNVSDSAFEMFWLSFDSIALICVCMYVCLCLSMSVWRTCVLCFKEEQAAKMKANNIRVALEKIKEAQVKKVSWRNKENLDKSGLVYGVCAVCVFARPFNWTQLSGSGQLFTILKTQVNNSSGQNTLQRETGRESESVWLDLL